MQINTLDEFLNKYIEGYLLEDLINVRKTIPPKVHPGNAAYLMTGAICSGIEFLGALISTRTVTPGCEHCRKPEQTRSNFPFEHYCKDYLSQVDLRYKNLGPVLRELIRNGIAHSFATKGKIGITRIEGTEDMHLTRMTKEGFLVINSDRFLEDFAKSYYDFFKPDITNNEDKKQQALENFEYSRSVKEKEINRTMSAMEGKLEDWPRVYPEVDHMDHMVDAVEEYGDIPLVS